jgi:hypothetical protein
VTRERLKTLLEEYGKVALGTYFTLFLLVLLGFALAISTGFKPESAQGGASVFGAAYIATKVTQPIRIGATLLLTPIVARVLHKLGLLKAEKATSEPETTAKADPPESRSAGEV